MTPSEPSYRLIPLSRGLFAKVDESDFEWLSQWKWCALSTRRGFYAARNAKAETRQTLLMHRVIIGLVKGDLRMADHANGDTLDNCRSNLRIASIAQNSWNAKKRSDNTSGFKGARFQKKIKRWVADITHNSQRVHLGTFATAEEAHNAYQLAAERLYGEFARFK